MTKTKRIFLPAAVILTLLLTLLVLPGAVKAETITSTLNLVNVRQNERGDGYYWANRYDILTLDGISIDTTDAYGLRLPQNCTVELKGTNYIKAAKYALSCSGTVSFKGSGTLVLDGGEAGLFIYSEVSTDKIRLLDGKYEIHGGKYGVLSTAADFSFVDGKMDITIDAPEGAAVSGRCVNLVGGSFKANGSVEASHELVVKGINLDIASTKPALVSKTLNITDIALDGGGEYGDQAVVKAKSTEKNDRKSAIFGDSVPGFVDVILLIVVIAAIAALIVVPVLRRRKKTKELYERLEKEGFR